ncbi:MAG: prepilin-type N-terminal cleavage/methylation domain-containing protein [Ruminiclostridium sp.]|nr:prepilin-type N-terminal cleavage/methylation domain-containing protein [Ruminiclostridium sp.]
MQRLKRKKGVTLIEMTVVIAIISILASFMLPSVTHYFTDAKIMTANASAAQIRKAVTGFLLELNLQGKGMKRGKHLNAQMIFMCSNHRWMVKTECKVNESSGYPADTNGKMTFYDHTNWWYQNKARLLPTDTSVYDPNHSLAMCRLVAEMLGDVDNGLVAIFFNDSICRGVAYLPDYTIVWDQTDYRDIPADVMSLFTFKDGSTAYPISDSQRLGQRPLLLREHTDSGYHMKAFSPFVGNWPEEADYRIWKDQAGIDQQGWIVGTSPSIGYTEKLVP